MEGLRYTTYHDGTDVDNLVAAHDDKLQKKNVVKEEEGSNDDKLQKKNVVEEEEGDDDDKLQKKKLVVGGWRRRRRRRRAPMTNSTI